MRLIPLGLAALLLLAACAPAATAVPAPSTEIPRPTETAAPAPTTTSGILTQTDIPADTAATDPLPAATSRGPDLHASDPSTVQLASGGLQLVEFFRFT